jgi:hypothetical protein
MVIWRRRAPARLLWCVVRAGIASTADHEARRTVDLQALGAPHAVYAGRSPAREWKKRDQAVR